MVSGTRLLWKGVKLIPIVSARSYVDNLYFLTGDEKVIAVF